MPSDNNFCLKTKVECKINFTKKRIAEAKSAEDLVALAKENGIEMTAEEAAKYFADFHKEGELSDEELSNVAGGGCGEDPHDPHDDYPTGSCFLYTSDTKCPVCGAEMSYNYDRVIVSFLLIPNCCGIIADK